MILSLEHENEKKKIIACLLQLLLKSAKFEHINSSQSKLSDPTANNPSAGTWLERSQTTQESFICNIIVLWLVAAVEVVAVLI